MPAVIQAIECHRNDCHLLPSLSYLPDMTTLHVVRYMVDKVLLLSDEPLSGLTPSCLLQERCHKYYSCLSSRRNGVMGAKLIVRLRQPVMSGPPM